MSDAIKFVSVHDATNRRNHAYKLGKAQLKAWHDTNICVRIDRKIEANFRRLGFSNPPLGGWSGLHANDKRYGAHSHSKGAKR